MKVKGNLKIQKLVSCSRMPHNVPRLGEGGDFTTELSYEAPKFKFSKNCHTKH